MKSFKVIIIIAAILTIIVNTLILVAVFYPVVKEHIDKNREAELNRKAAKFLQEHPEHLDYSVEFKKPDFKKIEKSHKSSKTHEVTNF